MSVQNKKIPHRQNTLKIDLHSLTRKLMLEIVYQTFNRELQLTKKKKR